MRKCLNLIRLTPGGIRRQARLERWNGTVEYMQASKDLRMAEVPVGTARTFEEGSEVDPSNGGHSSRLKNVCNELEEHLEALLVFIT